MGRIIQGYWDCPHCGEKEIKADPKKPYCSKCGEAQGAGVKFYIRDPNEVADQEIVEATGTKPKWVCNLCGAYNHAEDIICQSCRNIKDGQTHTYFSQQAGSSTRRLEISNKTQTILICSILALLLTGAIISLIWVLTPKEDTLEIITLSWESAIEVEVYQTCQESDWYLPPGARLQSTAWEIRGYESVFSHYEYEIHKVPKERIIGYNSQVVGHRDLGNGLFEEIIDEVPIYETYYEDEEERIAIYVEEPQWATKYYYEIDRWVYARSISKRGQDRDPSYEDLVLRKDERERTRYISYLASAINSKGETKQYSFSTSDWYNLEVGRRYKVLVSLGNSASLIENVKRN